MVDLRRAARGEPCEVRIPGICNGDPATTVLAHIRMAGITGMGMKAPDLLGAHCCGSCHDAADRRTHKDLDLEYVRLMHLEGMARTIAKLIKRGLIK